MKPRLPLAVVVVVGMSALAQASPQTARARSEPSTVTASLAAPEATTLSVRGTVDKYDASTGILSLSTPSGTMQFQVASATRIRQGWHARGALELSQLAGYKVTVRYTEVVAGKILESIHIFGKGERLER